MSVIVWIYIVISYGLFHLILRENSKHLLLTCIALNTPNHVTDNLLVIMDSKPNRYYYLLLCHYSSFVFTKEMLKSLVIKYKY